MAFEVYAESLAFQRDPVGDAGLWVLALIEHLGAVVFWVLEAARHSRLLFTT